MSGVRSPGAETRLTTETTPCIRRKWHNTLYHRRMYDAEDSRGCDYVYGFDRASSL